MVPNKAKVGQSEGMTRRKRGATDEDQDAPSKRSRVSRACDQCRVGRERCDGNQPTCGTCETQARSCSYDEKPKKRGIQPHYIRTLELTIAWVFRTFPEVEQALSAALPDGESHARRLISNKDPVATERLHSSWRSCLVNTQIDQVLSGTAVDAAGSLASIHHAMEDMGSTDRAVDRTPGQGTTPFKNDTHPSALINQGHTLPRNAWTLLEYYFAFTQAWLPITEKHSILKLMYLYPPEGLSLGQMNDSQHAELWSILALAGSQVPHLSTPEELAQAQQLADSLLPSGQQTYEVSHLKALILRAVDDFQKDNVLSAWLRIGTAARMLVLFRLLSEGLGQNERRCQHVHLATFVVESALALRLKAVRHLRPDYIASIGFVMEDGLEEWTPWVDPILKEGSTASRAPVKSMSTLNLLCRHFLAVEEDPTGAATPPENQAEIVPFLLQNARSTQGRFQPSVLVGSLLHSTSDMPRDWAMTNQQDPGPSWSTASTDATIPEPSAVDRVTDSAGVPMQVGGLASADVMSTDLAFDQTGSEKRSHGSDVASFDIFDELAALERQDSTNHPQFIQNLGFPDLDLAQFFGADYLPTDPQFYSQGTERINPDTHDYG